MIDFHILDKIIYWLDFLGIFLLGFVLGTKSNILKQKSANNDC